MDILQVRLIQLRLLFYVYCVFWWFLPFCAFFLPSLLSFHKHIAGATLKAGISAIPSFRISGDFPSLGGFSNDGGYGGDDAL